MATADEANDYLGSLAAGVDESLSVVGPEMTFALVVWKKGDAGKPEATACFNPPATKRGEVITALRTLATALENMPDG